MTTANWQLSGDFLELCNCEVACPCVMQGQTAYVQAGAGIVADSVPETEFHETLSKAKGLLKAIEIAEQQL